MLDEHQHTFDDDGAKLPCVPYWRGYNYVLPGYEELVTQGQPDKESPRLAKVLIGKDGLVTSSE